MFVFSSPMFKGKTRLVKQFEEVKTKRTPSRGSWLSLETKIRGEEMFLLNFSVQTQGKHQLRNKAACKSNA